MMIVFLTLAGDGGIVTVGEGVGGDDDLVSDGWGGLAVCRLKKEDWLPKMERNQRTPGRRRSQEDIRGFGELQPRARVFPVTFSLLTLG